LTSRRPSACQTDAKPNLQSKLEDKQFYKDSVNILGMSIDELMDDFVQAPVWEQHVQSSVERLNALTSEDNAHLAEAVDQVCTLCLKLIGDFNS